MRDYKSLPHTRLGYLSPMVFEQLRLRNVA